MKTTITRFTRSLVLFSATLGIAGMIMLFLVPELLSPAAPWLLLLFFAITFTIFYYGDKASEQKFSKFVNYYLVMSMLKLLLLLIATATYIYLRRDDAIRFAVTLLILFFSYLLFEVIWLVKLKDKE